MYKERTSWTTQEELEKEAEARETYPNLPIFSLFTKTMHAHHIRKENAIKSKSSSSVTLKLLSLFTNVESL